MSLLRPKHVDFDQVWIGIESSVQVLLGGEKKPFTNEEWQEVYRGVYNICTNPGSSQSERLFNQLRDLLIQRVIEISEKIELIFNDVEFLSSYCTEFERYSIGTSYVSDLFSYLNRYWIHYAHAEYGQAPIPGVYPIPELALHIWHDELFLKLKKRILNSILNIFRIARESENQYFQDGDLIGKTIQIYITLGLNKQDPLKLYREELESYFLKDAAIYYSALSNLLLSKLSISNYLIHINTVSKKEEEICTGKMHRITLNQVRQTCCMMLVEKHTEEICHAADIFLENGQEEDLQRIFILFSELISGDPLISLKNSFKKFIEKNGLEYLKRLQNDEKNPEKYIDALVDTRNKYFKLVTYSFSSHPLMRSALDQAFRTVSNSYLKLPELLAKYAHNIMLRHHASDEIELKIENVGIVFCLLDEKDIFKHIYAKLLSKRLIQGSTASLDIEALLVNKLGEICGCDFVSKLQKMFSDKTVSSSLNQSYKTWRLEQEDEIDQNERVEISFDVLTAGIWPIQTPTPEEELNFLPAVFQQQVKLFEKYYVAQSTGRRLHWVHDRSHGIIKANLGRRLYEFHASYCQMVILLLFNQRDSYSEDEIIQIFQTTKIDPRFHLKSLYKIKLLIKRTETLDGIPSISLNSKFSHSRHFVKILPYKIHHETEILSTSTNAREITEDRKMTIQAAIVRIMKTRREYSFGNIYTEIKRTLAHQFLPTKIFLEENLSILVEKDYIRIDESKNKSKGNEIEINSIVYLYVA